MAAEAWQKPMSVSKEENAGGKQIIELEVGQ
jgi:hypothetical protein